MANFKKSNKTITPKFDADVDFQEHQSMGGNRVTNAADAVLDHDYITKQQFDNHGPIYHTVSGIHTNASAPHDTAYWDNPHNHNYLWSGTTGYQWFGQVLMQWGVSPAFHIETNFYAVNPGVVDSRLYVMNYTHHPELDVTFPVAYSNIFSVMVNGALGDSNVCLGMDATEIHWSVQSASTTHLYVNARRFAGWNDPGDGESVRFRWMAIGN